MMHLFHQWMRVNKERRIFTLKETKVAIQTSPFGLYRCKICGVEKWLELSIPCPTGDIPQRVWAWKDGGR